MLTARNEDESVVDEAQFARSDTHVIPQQAPQRSPSGHKPPSIHTVQESAGAFLVVRRQNRAKAWQSLRHEVESNNPQLRLGIAQVARSVAERPRTRHGLDAFDTIDLAMRERLEVVRV